MVSHAASIRPKCANEDVGVRIKRSALYPFQRLPSEVYLVDSSTGRREGQDPPASSNAFVGLAPRRLGRDHILWGVAPRAPVQG